MNRKKQLAANETDVIYFYHSVSVKWRQKKRQKSEKKEKKKVRIITQFNLRLSLTVKGKLYLESLSSKSICVFSDGQPDICIIF